ncbi:MAG: DUF799 domain-containing protein [Paraglaciecola sp.]|uniref:DUF799 domain-containing protein n=1 Tax=Alishewanella maricola TaxID=2795740 RepID=A0ABS8C283_9ALTE|nr:GNA1162 family protein [Alishewanella maricola]MCB5226435.1 DUF799 domain-containing protein [Alishewanella maricola]MDP4944454.1 DUF799 domain-containing protein [Alishewanella sp.]MDP5132368.1 DUF799 domain-containing protein [Paraglaciecola sp.]
MKLNVKLAFIGFVALITGCASPMVTKQDAFPKMYTERPLSILVVPAINRSTAADAPDLYSITIAQPIAEAGYYVMPIPLTNLLLNQEGIIDGAQLREVNASKFKQLFGADAVLFVTINKWDTNYYVTGGNVTVGAEFDLVSTQTSEVLWNYNSMIVHNTSGNSGNLIADIISTAITTALTDYVPIAHIVNATVVNTMPVGKYHVAHGKDGAMQSVNKNQSTQTK